MPHISVIIPVYRSAGCLEELNRRLIGTLSRIDEDFEILYVEDGGGDCSWSIIQSLALHDPRIKGLRLCRNFGQHYALTAGLDHARGDWIVTMDCDLQDRPEIIAELYSKAQEGFDVVLARRLTREDPWLNGLLARIFYLVFDYLTDTRTDPTVGTLRILSRKVVDTFVSMREQLRFFGGMVQWMGYRTTTIDVERSGRFAGTSSYTLAKRLRLAGTAIVSFSDKPLFLSIKVGFVISVISVLVAFYLVYLKFAQDVTVEGWTSVMVSMFLLSGLIFMNLGVLGIYIGKVFQQSKGRPFYIVDDATFAVRRTSADCSESSRSGRG